jgi:TetR/AcrR family transcriptional regulator
MHTSAAGRPRGRGPRRRPRPGPRPRGADPASSRRRLFEAAAREFAAHGFAGASVDRIAAAARLNKAMIYYHFGSKAGLYREILREMFGAVGARVRDVAASAAPPEEQIRLFIAAIAVEAEARPHFPPIWFREIADGGVHLDQDILRGINGVVTTLAGFVAAGARAGRFRRINPVLVHAGIVAPLLLFFASQPLRERMERMGIRGAAQFDSSEVVEHIQRVTTDLLRRPAPGSKRTDRPAGTGARSRR